ncbi:hypothetical protein EDE12_103147 [Methylosinus sp. sav-2]|nr:hypothetical protein EDE12_103147 [Methylosinus sp. sav-2]
MATEHDLIALADAYAALTGASETTISSRVFGDSKKLAAVRRGKDITLRRFNAAIGWFADNWPTDADWPLNIRRANGAASPSSLFPAESDA